MLTRRGLLLGTLLIPFVQMVWIICEWDGVQYAAVGVSYQLEKGTPFYSYGMCPITQRWDAAGMPSTEQIAVAARRWKNWQEKQRWFIQHYSGYAYLFQEPVRIALQREAQARYQSEGV